jgi:hypothetical protein
MTILDDGPSLMQCLAAAVDAHQAFHRARIAPPRTEPEEPPDNPLLKQALDQLQDGDLKGCVATMKQLDARSRFTKQDPPPDPDDLSDADVDDLFTDAEQAEQLLEPLKALRRRVLAARCALRWLRMRQTR